MPSANVILQLYKVGWREQTAVVVEDNLRIEMLLGTGAIDSEDEAIRVCTGQLALYAMPLEARTVAVEPVDVNDTPWLSHIPGQTILEGAAQQVVESLSYSRDEDGHLDYAAELNTHLDSEAERFSLALKKFSNGTGGGTLRPSQPVNLNPPAQLYTPAGDPCCTNGFNGRQSFEVPASDEVEVVVAAPQFVTGGDLFPGATGDALLPPGMWHVTGSAVLVFPAPATGSFDIQYRPSPLDAGEVVAVRGGVSQGRVVLAGVEEAVIHFDGVLLQDGVWAPELVLINNTSEDCDATVRYNATGGCPCSTSTTTSGG